MSKPGPKPLPPERRRSVRVVIRVTAEVADGMFLFAGRNRKTLSEITRGYYERLLARERELVSCQITGNRTSLTH